MPQQRSQTVWGIQCGVVQIVIVSVCKESFPLIMNGLVTSQIYQRKYAVISYLVWPFDNLLHVIHMVKIHFYNKI